jgi:hypothetical protein
MWRTPSKPLIGKVTVSSPMEKATQWFSQPLTSLISVVQTNSDVLREAITPRMTTVQIKNKMCQIPPITSSITKSLLA